ncbi:MAG TPA: hypothetical protein VFU40_07090 [Gemmatimonadales bacterium]|nr:hypothetical protein [Gemmatimonadales bacterium]
MRSITRAVLVGLLAVSVAACDGYRQQPSKTPVPVATSAAHPVPTADPYETYLKANPDPDLILTREDAQLRAYLGCGQTFAPGTIDRVLADAYRPLGICER